MKIYNNIYIVFCLQQCCYNEFCNFVRCDSDNNNNNSNNGQHLRVADTVMDLGRVVDVVMVSLQGSLEDHLALVSGSTTLALVSATTSDMSKQSKHMYFTISCCRGSIKFRFHNYYIEEDDMVGRFYLHSISRKNYKSYCGFISYYKTYLRSGLMRVAQPLLNMSILENTVSSNALSER